MAEGCMGARELNRAMQFAPASPLARHLCVVHIRAGRHSRTSERYGSVGVDRLWDNIQTYCRGSGVSM